MRSGKNFLSNPQGKDGGRLLVFVAMDNFFNLNQDLELNPTYREISGSSLQYLFVF